MVDIYICLVINTYLFHLSRKRQNKLSHRFFKLYILKVKDKKTRKHPQMRMLSFWRRERDSNPRVLSHKLISSQPRYDHFDISP